VSRNGRPAPSAAHGPQAVSGRREPVGRTLAQAAKRVGAAFNASLASEGGSVPAWLILTSLRQARWRTQRELAGSLGIVGPTLTRHIDNLERMGWVVRHRAESDRRAVRVEITDAGAEAHGRMRRAVVAFDRRLRAGLTDEQLQQLEELLDRLVANAGPGD
jgi:MarR family transcriptional regulator, transcriptional regulator for hemolysin